MDLENKTTNSFDEFCKAENLKLHKYRLTYPATIQTREEWEKEHKIAMCLAGGAW